MMSCGKHVIATNYSAHTEFCNEENCRLIEIDKLESAYDGKWFFYQGQWGSLGDKQNESLVKNFREIHELKKTGNLGVNISGIETATKFSWENLKTVYSGSKTNRHYNPTYWNIRQSRLAISNTRATSSQ